MEKNVEAKPIRKLDEVVVNRIAAGEVIHRPANALKEMIENSIDAKATNIQITVIEGGLKLLNIQDNGHGIRKEDLDIVCERFTTSKLREYDDLQSISTYGFRGEALASISHIAHVSITTRTSDSHCAFQVLYGDGKPKGPPKPCAGNQGTTISVEDMFYNVPIRRKAFQSASLEYAKIADVVGRYAIHNSQIGFTLKKQVGTMSDLKTMSSSTTKDNIRTVYGAEIAKELREIDCRNDSLNFKMAGLISDLNCTSKKHIFLLFINHRLVECVALKKAIDAIYATYLQKQKFPFVYLSLEIEPQNVDVNVHPTKQEVHFLHEVDIIMDIEQAIQSCLLESGQTRTMYIQTLMPFTKDALKETENKADKSSRSDNVYPYEVVRTDCREQKLEAFVLSRNATKEKMGGGDQQDAGVHTTNVIGIEAQAINKASFIFWSLSTVPRVKTHSSSLWDFAVSISINRKTTFTNVLKEKSIPFTSVSNMRKEIEESCDRDLREVFHKHTFVGCVSGERALVQHETKLYLLNTHSLSQQLFYQIMAYDFGNFSAMKLSEPASIYELVSLALEHPEGGWEESYGPKHSIATFVATFLPTKCEMLLDLFSMEISKDGNLISIPYLLENYVPALERLPFYILRLATEVDWTSEEECFKTFCVETSRFYAFPTHYTIEMEEEEEGHDVASCTSSQAKSSSNLCCDRQSPRFHDSPNNKHSSQTKVPSWKWTVEHVIYPAFRHGLQPDKDNVNNGNILQVASLRELYKVFERC